MCDIKIAIKIALSVDKHLDQIDKFALDRFGALFYKQENVHYIGYEIINEYTIRIKYEYGSGDNMKSHWLDLEVK